MAALTLIGRWNLDEIWCSYREDPVRTSPKMNGFDHTSFPHNAGCISSQLLSLEYLTEIPQFGLCCFNIDPGRNRRANSYTNTCLRVCHKSTTSPDGVSNISAPSSRFTDLELLPEVWSLIGAEQQFHQASTRSSADYPSSEHVLRTYRVCQPAFRTWVHINCVSSIFPRSTSPAPERAGLGPPVGDR